MLLVNTASACGYTPQYDDLQKLHEQYKNKLAVIGFPSNDFGEQEKGSDEEGARGGDAKTRNGLVERRGGCAK